MLYGAYRGIRFQFHKGTIRTLWVMSILPVVVSFNSIKVRLERAHGWDYDPQRGEVSIP